MLVRPERDPKVFWYNPGKHWVMMLYGDSQYHILTMALYQVPMLSLHRSHVNELRGQATPLQTYQIESCADLGNPSWINIGSTTADGTGRFTFPVDPALPMRFFRAGGEAPSVQLN